jgi:DNA polymerase III gamma/tau subunit
MRDRRDDTQDAKERLKDAAQEAKDATKSYAYNAKEQAKDSARESSEKAKDVTEKLKDYAQDAKEKLKDYAQAAKEKVKETFSGNTESDRVAQNTKQQTQDSKQDFRHASKAATGKFDNASDRDSWVNESSNRQRENPGSVRPDSSRSGQSMQSGTDPRYQGVGRGQDERNKMGSAEIGAARDADMGEDITSIRSQSNRGSVGNT